MLDPIGGFERIRDFYITYLETAFRIKDREISSERRKLLESANTFCTEPLIEPLPIYESVDYALHDLASGEDYDSRLPGFDVNSRRAFVDLALAGLLESELAKDGSRRIGSFPLYVHQAEMLRKGTTLGSPGIVTSGTGSGKTESFLMPVLATIMRESLGWARPSPSYLSHRWWQDVSGVAHKKWTDVDNRPSAKSPDSSPFKSQRLGEAKDRPAAVRALILYPMNALVEDQLSRIRRALDSDSAREVVNRWSNGNRIFFGRYTGETPVTGFHKHPRPSVTEHDRRARKLSELFRISSSIEHAQNRAREMDRLRSEGDDEIRYLFPSIDGAEMTSRWDMQDFPPDLLITNVSMLSAMLTREVDAPILNKTREWITSNDASYFFLVLDELHLQRGSAGTETSYLLRLLFERLGLCDPAHRHKLRILASSASLPVTGELTESSLAYLWDMFGKHGLHSTKNSTIEASVSTWKGTIIAGKTIDAEPRETKKLDARVFVKFLQSAGARDENDLLPHPTQLQDAWTEVSRGLYLTGNRSLKEVVSACVEEAGARIAHACWSEKDQRARATPISELAVRMFGSDDGDAIVAVRALLVIRGSGDDLRAWWPEALSARANTFRVHTFFRSIEGLFAPLVTPSAEGRESTGSNRLYGELSVERGLRFARTTTNERGNRILELVYCESCGELFVGGRRGRHGNSIELLPAEPDIDSLPERATQDFFENLSADDFALFWPKEEWPGILQHPKNDVHVGEWQRAFLDPVAGTIGLPRIGASIPTDVVPGFFWERGNNQDHHKRSRTQPGTAVPYECPACGSDYFWRKKGQRLSPIRNFRAGFAKTTQLLATELYDLLRIRDGRPKLVAFADSRQDAARAALDIERRHHEDLRREILVASIRSIKTSKASKTDLIAERETLLSTLKDRIAAGDAAKAVLEISPRLQELETGINELSNGNESLALTDVLESHRDGSKFSGSRVNRDPLRALISGFARLGIHPTDPTGTKRIKLPNGDSVLWEELFEFNTNGLVDWRDDPVQQDQLNAARQSIVGEMQRLVTGVIFSKTYFALEETGLAYPTVGEVVPEADRNLANAFLRVLADSYRLVDSPFEDAMEVDPWKTPSDISATSRVRRFANRIWSNAGIDQGLGKVLMLLEKAGHPQGRILTSSLRIRLAEPTDSFWRCNICSRVHLTRGVGYCTRCYRELTEEPSGKCSELYDESYLSKRVVRGRTPARLRCEELTGQTEDPGDRQRRFKNIVVSETGAGELHRLASIIDLLAVTTTMEVGIDIGPLRAVFQANMPPQRFNYQQRVGRAGRRRQAYSFVITICRSKSHDLHYFLNPDSITGDPPPPPFLTKKQASAAKRFLRKAWLTAAFELIRSKMGDSYPGDSLRKPDIHGEFVPAEIYFDKRLDWKSKLSEALKETVADKSRAYKCLTEDSPLYDSVELNGMQSAEILSEIESAGEASTRQEGLAHTLAEAGLLPMYGMPTRVRNLYLGDETSDDALYWRKWRSVDRDLDIAVFEFAPGAVLTKDKQEHICVGFTGALPDYQQGKKAKRDLNPLEAAFAAPFWLNQCAHCGSWQRFDQDPTSLGDIECKACRRLLDLTRAGECRTPNGFRTDFWPRQIEADVGISGRHRLNTAEGRSLALSTDAHLNLSFSCEPLTRLYRLNRGRPDSQALTEWSGFHITAGSQRYGRNDRVILHDQWIASDVPQPRGFDPTGKDVQGVWLAAPKTTDVLFLAPTIIQPGLQIHAVSASQRIAGVRAAAISAAFIIVNRAAGELDIDPEEFDIIEPRIHRAPNGQLVPLLQIADHLINGAGFSERLASNVSGRPLISTIVQSILNDKNRYPLKDFLRRDSAHNHPSECDQACYRCLQRYSNQSYHGLLDWRLGLSFLGVLNDASWSCGLDGKFDGPGLWDWQSLAIKYANDLGRFSDVEKRDVRGLVAVRLSKRSKWAVIVHPLWDTKSLHGVMGQAADELEQDTGEVPTFIDTFELARRLLAVRQRLLNT
jgi:hypothetical protein